MVKAVTPTFPVNFQNAGRYLASLLLLWPAYLLTADRGRIRSDLAAVARLAPKILVVALVQYGFQFGYTFSLTLIYPGLMTLVQQGSAIFGVVLGLAFFPDERRVVRDRLFLAGAALAFPGAVLVVLGGGSWGAAALNVGVVSALASAFCWALLGTLIRRWLSEVPPLLAISSVITILVPLFLASHAIAGRGFPVPAATAAQWAMMIASGLVGVGLGQSLFYRAVPVIGVATSTSIGLLIPLLAAVVSWIAFGERLSALQLAGGALLVLGSWFVVRRRLAVKT
jgi:drug/metabolite transporter (DMT)-like permease